jgi:prophage regulatory protein
MVQVILRRAEVERATGYRRSSLYQLVKDGRFPRPVKLDAKGRAVGWLEGEIKAWQESRIAARDAATQQ